MITMTGDRQGWKADVENVAKMFKRLDFLVDYEYDLTYKVFFVHIFKKLM